MAEKIEITEQLEETEKSGEILIKLCVECDIQ